MVILFGYYIDITYPSINNQKENYENMNIQTRLSDDKKTEIVKSCYDKIVKRDGEYYMFNSALPLEMNINPIVFNSLEDFANWNRRKSLHLGYDCPLLYYSGKNDDYVHPEEDFHPVSMSNLKPISNNPNIKINKVYNPSIIAKPYAKTPIDNLDGYEYNRIFGLNHLEEESQEKKTKIETMQNDPKLPHTIVKYQDYSDEMYDNNEIQPLTQQELEYEKMLQNPVPKENPIVEESMEIIKEKYLQEHPEYSDVKMERTGFNQYQIVEVVPQKATEEEWKYNISNRPDENEIIPADMETYGEGSKNLSYLNHTYLFENNMPTDTVERMFAPTLPRDIWYQKEN
jgi:hypothetical protein